MMKLMIPLRWSRPRPTLSTTSMTSTPGLRTLPTIRTIRMMTLKVPAPVRKKTTEMTNSLLRVRTPGARSQRG
jgi:hypothetical protein